MSTSLQPVLTIGVAGHGGMTTEQMQEATLKMSQVAAPAGIAFEARFIHPDFPEQERVELRELLQSRSWAVVSIGSGLRLTAERTRLLEDVVNLVLTAVRPTPKLAFPTLPEEMIPTFQRLLGTASD